METFFELDGLGIKKLSHLINNVFIVYSPRTVTIEPASSIKTDTSIILHLPKKAKAFIVSKFRGKKIYEINRRKSRLWDEILNTSYFEKLKIKNKIPLRFLVIEPETLKFT